METKRTKYYKYVGTQKEADDYGLGVKSPVLGQVYPESYLIFNVGSDETIQYITDNRYAYADEWQLVEEIQETVLLSDPIWVNNHTVSVSNQGINRPQPFDMVNHPPHYNQGKVECIDAIMAATINKSGNEAVLVGHVLRYLWRYEEKEGIVAVKKAQWYLNKLIEEMQTK